MQTPALDASLPPTLSGPHGLRRERHTLKLRPLRVAGVTDLSPQLRRLHLTGDELHDFLSLGFDDHVKLFFDTPSGQQRRDFTPRAFDAARCTLDIDFALHPHGPASDFARHARVGDALTVGGPRGSMVVAPEQDWHLLVADLCALPAVERRLAELPAGQIAAVHLLADAADHRPLHSAATVSIHWHTSEPALLQALSQWPRPEGAGLAWGAGEAALMRRVREQLVAVQRLPNAALRVSAYWKAGQADFHEPIDG